VQLQKLFTDDPENIFTFELLIDSGYWQSYSHPGRGASPRLKFGINGFKAVARLPEVDRSHPSGSLFLYTRFP
jgi:hypothetical protein